MTTGRQLAMVINLDKCIGCQTCTVSCKTHWTADKEGAENIYYMWCETKPGLGWPKDWMNMGDQQPRWLEDYGGTWQFNWEEVYNSPARSTYLHATAKETGKPVEWGPVWEDDKGGGEWPNGYYFYMPRMCNQCTDAPCIKACAEHCQDVSISPPVMSKRAADGTLTIDKDSCDSCGMCVGACPYKIPMRNQASGSYEACNFCAERTDRGYAPVCAKSCPARAMYFGWLDDKESWVHKLVEEYKVALPLRPDYGTKPNVYYIPPFIRPKRFGEGNQPLEETDIPVELLREYFGPGVNKALATLREHREMATRGEHSELAEMLIIYRWADAFKPFEVVAPREVPVAPPATRKA
ncbi:MAG: 4Fe-4S dicluster domain-containing protein [Sterolibacterium sp.]